MRTFSFLPALFILIAIFGIITFSLTKIFVKIFPNFQKFFHKIWLIYFGLVLLFPIGMIFGRMTDIAVFQIFYVIGGIFMGSILLNFLVLIPIFLIHFFFKNRGIKFLQIFTIFAILGINFYGIFASFSPQIVNYTINFSEPHDFHGKKFVLIADTHYGYVFGENSAKNLVAKINEINPDFVLIAGDFFDGPKIDFEKIAKIFDNVNAEIFYANGNHEEYSNTDEILSAIAKTKIQILNNEITDFGSLQIAGVTYHENKDENNFEKILETIRPSKNKPSILIKHEPKGHNISEKFGFDLVVSGHTHRGQMWPFSYIPEKIYGKYVYGLVKDKTQYALTTSGIGDWGPPQRFGTRSEIVVVEVE